MPPRWTVGQLHNTTTNVHARQLAASECIKLNDVSSNCHRKDCLCWVKCSGLRLLGSISYRLEAELASG